MTKVPSSLQLKINSILTSQRSLVPSIVSYEGDPVIILKLMVLLSILSGDSKSIQSYIQYITDDSNELDLNEEAYKMALCKINTASFVDDVLTTVQLRNSNLKDITIEEAIPLFEDTNKSIYFFYDNLCTFAINPEYDVCKSLSGGKKQRKRKVMKGGDVIIIIDKVKQIFLSLNMKSCFKRGDSVINPVQTLFDLDDLSLFRMIGQTEYIENQDTLILSSLSWHSFRSQPINVSSKVNVSLLNTRTNTRIDIDSTEQGYLREVLYNISEFYKLMILKVKNIQEITTQLPRYVMIHEKQNGVNIETSYLLPFIYYDKNTQTSIDITTTNLPIIIYKPRKTETVLSSSRPMRLQPIYQEAEPNETYDEKDTTLKPYFKLFNDVLNPQAKQHFVEEYARMKAISQTNTLAFLRKLLLLTHQDKLKATVVNGSSLYDLLTPGEKNKFIQAISWLQRDIHTLRQQRGGDIPKLTKEKLLIKGKTKPNSVYKDKKGRKYIKKNKVFISLSQLRGKYIKFPHKN